MSYIPYFVRRVAKNFYVEEQALQISLWNEDFCLWDSAWLGEILCSSGEMGRERCFYWSKKEITSGRSFVNILFFDIIWTHHWKQLMWFKTTVCFLFLCAYFGVVSCKHCSRNFNFVIDLIIFLMHFEDSGVGSFLLLFFVCFLVGERKANWFHLTQKGVCLFPTGLCLASSLPDISSQSRDWRGIPSLIAKQNLNCWIEHPCISVSVPVQGLTVLAATHLFVTPSGLKMWEKSFSP